MTRFPPPLSDPIGPAPTIQFVHVEADRYTKLLKLEAAVREMLSSKNLRPAVNPGTVAIRSDLFEATIRILYDVKDEP